MRKVCFVNFEISPFTAGGIGAWLGNTLRHFAGTDCEIHVLYYGDKGIDDDTFQAIYPRVFFHAIDPANYKMQTYIKLDLTIFDSRFQRLSCALNDALVTLEDNGTVFDIVEFVDWGGLASVPIQTKVAGRAFQNTLLTVRCHGTEGLLRQFESRPWSLENMVMLDLERYALAHADLVVAHLETTKQSFIDYYGFDAEWAKKVHVELPAMRSGDIPVNKTIEFDSKKTKIVFSSKFQSIKRPETFVRGAIGFMDENPTYLGKAYFCAFETDKSYTDRVRAEIPDEMRGRFVYNPIQGIVREKIIASSVVVFPNANETFCYAAYEAAMSGAIVILNEKNPAFADNTPWIDGENCVKFDGSAWDLQCALNDIAHKRGRFSSGRLIPLQYVADETPYWLQAEPKRTGPAKKAAKSQNDAVTVIIVHVDQPFALRDNVISVLSSADVVTRVIVVDDRSESSESAHVLAELKKLEASASNALMVIERPSRAGLSVAINQALKYVTTPIVGVLLPHERADDNLCAIASRCLSSNGGFDIMVPSALSQTDISCDKGTRFSFCPLAEAVHTGMFLNRAVVGGFFCKTNLLANNLMSEILGCEQSYEFVMRAMSIGARVVAPIDATVLINEGAIHSIVWRDELERRDLMETVRRNFSMQTSNLRAPMSFIGDGELISSSWYLGSNLKSDAHNQNYSLPNTSELQELASIKASTSYRVAMRTALFVADRFPSVHRRVSRWLRH